MAEIDQQPQGQNQPSGREHIPVFNPNRWLWDFETEKPKKQGRPSGPGKKRNTNQTMMWNLVSSIMDFLFISLACFLIFWLISRTFDTSVRSAFLGLWKLTPVGTVALLYSFLWIYHVASPAVFSYTIGQWACQITRAPKELTFKWILKATLRLTLLLITGLVIIPLFSWASGVDLEETLTGLKLHNGPQ